jgi:hypothetical protein
MLPPAACGRGEKTVELFHRPVLREFGDRVRVEVAALLDVLALDQINDVLGDVLAVIADPLQQMLGLHRRKLLKLLDVLEGELMGQGSRYRLRDAYVARIFDLWDLLQTATRTLS